jgi:hypothetical protein
VTDAAQRAVVEATGIGFVQTAPGWAGIVAHTGAEAVAVLVDEPDAAAGGVPTVTILRPGQPPLRGTLSGSLSIGGAW